MLSLLLQARDEEGKPMSDAQLMAECLTLFGAGHETTATALTWAWYLLCQHPEQYQQVQREVDSVLQGRTPTYADLARLPYCLQVFKEAMRLYPPAYAFSRRALRDVEIDGYRVPKGWVVLIAPHTLHRRADCFPEPEQFDPERFTPAREKQLPRYAYLPFGAGPRAPCQRAEEKAGTVASSSRETFCKEPAYRNKTQQRQGCQSGVSLRKVLWAAK